MANREGFSYLKYHDQVMDGAGEGFGVYSDVRRESKLNGDLEEGKEVRVPRPRFRPSRSKLADVFGRLPETPRPTNGRANLGTRRVNA